MRKQPKLGEIETLALGVVRARARGKRAYIEADAKLDELLKQTEPGTIFDLGKRGTFVLKDDFASSHKAFRNTHFSRYSLAAVK